MSPIPALSFSPGPVFSLPQVGLLSYSHRPSPLLSLNSSYDPGIILQNIRNIPYMDPSGNNLGKGHSGHGLLGFPPGFWCPWGSDIPFLPGVAVVTAHRYLLALDAPGRRRQVPGVMVLLVDEPLRGDFFSPIREAQAAGKEQGWWAWGLGIRLAPAGLSCRLLNLSLGLKVMILGLAGADPEQLRRLVPGMDPVQNFFAIDDGPSLHRAVSGLATALCQTALTSQVWKGPLGDEVVEKRVPGGS